MKLRHVLLGLIIAVVALYFTFKNVSLSEVLHSIVQLRYQYLPIAAAIFGLVFVLRAYRWHFFCKSLSHIPTSRLYSPMMIGFMGNLLPARAGEFIRAYLLGKRERLSFSASFGTVVVERIFDAFSILVLIECILVIDPKTVLRGVEQGGGRLSTFIESFGAMGLSAVTGAIILGLMIFSYLLTHEQERFQRFMRIFTRFLPQRIQERIEEIFQVFIQGLGILKDPRGILVAIILSALVWVMIVFANYPMYYCYNIHDKLPLSSLITVIVFTCVAILLPTPGFVGPFQFAITFVLANLYGLDKSIAASFSLVTWFFQMALVFLAGLFFIIKDNVSFLELSRKASREIKEASKHSLPDE